MDLSSSSRTGAKRKSKGSSKSQQSYPVDPNPGYGSNQPLYPPMPNPYGYGTPYGGSNPAHYDANNQSYAQSQPYNPNAYGVTPGWDPNAAYYTPQQQPGMAMPGIQFLNDPMVSTMAKAFIGQGKQYTDQKLEKYASTFSKLKYYFAVDTAYVAKKLRLLLFPFTHSDWGQKFNENEPVAPRFDINAPDLYIPVMAFVTFILSVGLFLGTQERFNPEQLGILASSCLGWLIIEFVLIWGTNYVFAINTSLQFLDWIAFSSYKYVGMNLTIFGLLVLQNTGYYAALLYCSIAIVFFMMRTLRVHILPETNSESVIKGTKRRLYVLMFIAFLQPIMMWWLTSDLKFKEVKI